MIAINEVSIEHPEHVGSEYFILEYTCTECGKIRKQIYTKPSDDYHDAANLCVSEHYKLHAESELGRKFYDVISIIKEFNNAI